MKIINKRDVIKSVWRRWNEQYPDDGYRFSSGKFAGETRQRLAALNFETCSSAEVDTAIGTSGWSDNQCDECERDCETLVHIGEEPDYEVRWQELCAECLSKALALTQGTTPNASS